MNEHRDDVEAIEAILNDPRFLRDIRQKDEILDKQLGHGVSHAALCSAIIVTVCLLAAVGIAAWNWLQL